MDFKLDEHGFSWSTRVVLPSLAGFLDRSQAYAGPGSQSPGDGSIELVFAPEGRDNATLEPHEIRLCKWVIDNERALSAAVIGAIFRYYPKLQEVYDYSAGEKAKFMPDISSPDDLKRLIGPYAINVHQLEYGGLPYIGFEFGCLWDEEHGLGVLMHGTRCVEVGGCDTAILLWIAKQDLDAQGQ